MNIRPKDKPTKIVVEYEQTEDDEVTFWRPFVVFWIILFAMAGISCLLGFVLALLP